MLRRQVCEFHFTLMNMMEKAGIMNNFFSPIFLLIRCLCVHTLTCTRVSSILLFYDQNFPSTDTKKRQAGRQATTKCAFKSVENGKKRRSRQVCLCEQKPQEHRKNNKKLFSVRDFLECNNKLKFDKIELLDERLRISFPSLPSIRPYFSERQKQRTV